MARYLTPVTPLMPATGDLNVHYFVRLFEDLDLTLAQDKANLYLLLLEDPTLPQFALIETEHSHYAGMANERFHVIMLTLMWVAGPTGYNPPP